VKLENMRDESLSLWALRKSTSKQSGEHAQRLCCSVELNNARADTH